MRKGLIDLPEPSERRILPPKSDVVFKRLFGDNRNIEFLRDFLMETLDIPAEEYDAVELIDPQLKREDPDDKLCVLDVLVKTKNGKLIDIEVQILDVPYMPERVTYYAAKLLASQLASGHNYEEVKKVVSIVILDHRLIRDSENYHNRYLLYDIKNRSRFTDVLEIDTLELPKLPKEPKPKEKGLYHWLRFIGAEKKEEFEMIAEQSPVIGKAYAVLKELSEDESLRMLHEAREKARRDEQARLDFARREGLAEGEAKGEARGKLAGLAEGKRETAQAMLAEAMPFDLISKITGLSIQEIEALRR
jgi:predicted transposase/invertase (TIGR01784 family)